MIARLRLARVQSAQGKYDDALATLKVEDAGEFAPRLADTRGDVLLAKGDRDGALREYLAARTGENNGRVDFDLLDLKIRDLGGTPPASAEESRGVLMKQLQPGCCSPRCSRSRACDSKDKKVDQPAELTDIKNPTVRIQKLWGASVGGGGKKLRLGLGLATAGNKLFAAGRDGDVAAFDLKTGKQLWRTETKLALAGGTGVGADARRRGFGRRPGGRARRRTTARERWRADVKGEILSAPAVAENEVIVRTVDGKLRALAIADGKEIWSAEQQIPRLTLRGAAAPVVARDVAISGFDNGRVLAVSLADGATVWDSPVSPSHGRTELERLNDIDAAVKVVGEEVFVAGFQGRAAMLALDSGQIWWTRDVSSYRGVDVDDEQMYVSHLAGRAGGAQAPHRRRVWRNESLKLRSLSAPAVVGRLRRGRRSRGLRALVRPRHRRRSPGAPRPAATASPMRRWRSTASLYVINDKGDIVALHGTPVGERSAREGRQAPPAPEPRRAAPAPGG